MDRRSFLKVGLFGIFIPTIIKPTWSQVLLVNKENTVIYRITATEVKMRQDEIRDFLERDMNRICGRIAQSLAINSPWINIIES